MDRLIERLLGEIVLDKVEQSVLGFVGGPVEDDGEPLLEIGVVLDHRLDIVHVEVEVAEHLAVRSEDHQRSVLLADLLLSAAVLQFASFVSCPGTLSVSEGFDIVALGKGVHCLGTHSVESYRFLEDLVIEFSSGVELGGRLDDGIERDSAAEVPHGDLPVRDRDLDLLAETGGKLVYAVVHYLFEEHIDSVTGVGPVPESSDVHARTSADMFHTFQGLDVGVCIFSVQYLCHIWGDMFVVTTRFSLLRCANRDNSKKQKYEKDA